MRYITKDYDKDLFGAKKIFFSSECSFFDFLFPPFIFELRDSYPYFLAPNKQDTQASLYHSANKLALYDPMRRDYWTQIFRDVEAKSDKSDRRGTERVFADTSVALQREF